MKMSFSAVASLCIIISHKIKCSNALTKHKLFNSTDNAHENSGISNYFMLKWMTAAIHLQSFWDLELLMASQSGQKTRCSKL